MNCVTSKRMIVKDGCNHGDQIVKVTAMVATVINVSTSVLYTLQQPCLELFMWTLRLATRARRHVRICAFCMFACTPASVCMTTCVQHVSLSV